MPLPRLLTTALWLAVTVMSTAMVWTATSIVAADVTDRPAPVLARRDVISELESSSKAAATIPTSSTLKTGTSTSVAPSRGPGRAPTTPNPPAPPPSLSDAPPPAVTIAPAAPPTTATTAPGAPPTTRSAGPPTTQAPPRPAATYSTSGGVVGVACNGLLIELIFAIASNGYAVDVVARGPANVDVRFVRSGQVVSVKAVCFGNPIRYDDQTPPRLAPR